MSDTCASCHYWRNQQGHRPTYAYPQSQNECRLKGPTYVAIPYNFNGEHRVSERSAFPLMFGEQWCGDYRASEVVSRSENPGWR